MTEFPASHRDLLDSRYAVLTTFAPSGYPQSTAISFFHEDGEVRASLNVTRKKVRNLRRDPRCTLFIHDFENPLRYLEIRGDAQLEHDEGKAFAARAGAKYNTDFTVHDGPGEDRVVLTLHPVAVNAVDLSRPPE